VCTSGAGNEEARARGAEWVAENTENEPPVQRLPLPSSVGLRVPAARATEKRLHVALVPLA
jgi:hypothetical protein